jgi:hypothetical protein
VISDRRPTCMATSTLPALYQPKPHHRRRQVRQPGRAVAVSEPRVAFLKPVSPCSGRVLRWLLPGGTATNLDAIPERASSFSNALLLSGPYADFLTHMQKGGSRGVFLGELAPEGPTLTLASGGLQKGRGRVTSTEEAAESGCRPSWAALVVVAMEVVRPGLG